MDIEIVVERTMAELHFDPRGAEPDDQRTVFMRCAHCHEEFLRPISLRQRAHCCQDGRWLVKATDPLPRLECRLIHKDAKYPYRKRTTDAGYDIASIEDVVVPKFGMANIHTGIIVVAPRGWYYTVDARSSLWTKNITPYRATIDGTYNGEMYVALMNSSEHDYMVHKGDRIAQIVLHKVIDFDLAPVEVFGSEYIGRGLEGFGSSGR